MEVRTGRLVVFAQHTDRFIVENDDMNSYTEAQSEMSLESRSFLHMVNDQVRKRQNQSSKDATKDSDKPSVKWDDCFCLLHYKRLYSWWGITQTFGIPSRIQKISQWNRCSTFLRNRYPNNQMSSMEWIQWTGKILHGSMYLWLVMKKSHQSRAHKGPRIFRFCIMPWKDEREPTIKYCMGRQIDVVHKFTGIQSFGQIWWWANGTRVEYLPRIHHIAVCPWSPRVTVKIERRTRRFHWTDCLHVDVQRHLMGIWRQWKRMRIKCSTRFSLCEEISSRTMVIPWTWIRKEMVFYSRIQSTRRMG